MKPELKQRIAQINAGTAPAGYKKTKVGIVPEEWDTVKLSSISIHRTEKNKDMKFTETYTNSATQGIIRQTDYFDKQISNNENIDGYYIVCENDYVYNPRISVSAPCGPISKSHIPETGIMSPLYTVFRLNREYENNAFIEYYFKSPFWHRYMTSIANYGARHDRMNITNADLFGMPIPFPPLPEQQKIAEILTAQDAVISLLQKQIELLQKQKKAFLQKMFPKKGCTIPEIRFAGFTDAWEQRKLGGAVSLRGRIGFRGYTQSDLVEKGKGAITFSPADIDESGHVSQDNNKYISWEKYEESPEIKVNNGDILFTKTASVGKVGYIQELREKATINPQIALLTPLKETDGYFTFLSVTTDVFMAQVRDITGGSSVPTMSQEKLKNLTFMLPLLAEQRKIASYFSNIDALITLHQRKLEIEQQKKKALMQLLLTGKVRVKT